MPHDDWARFDTVLPTAPQHGRFTEVGDNGWHMLLCWEAGPAQVVRVADDLTNHTVEVSGGNGPSWRVPRTSDDQATIEEGVNDYLADAGVPARPEGFVWYLGIPDGRDLKDLIDDVLAREKAHDAVRPRETAACMNAAVAHFYGGS